MSLNLGITRIFGIDNKIATILKNCNITTLRMLKDATRTAKMRKALADKTNLPIEYIYYWAKQVDLLQISDMTPENAVELIYAGIRSLEDVLKIDENTIYRYLKKNNPFTIITLEQIADWKKFDTKITTAFEIDENDTINSLGTITASPASHPNEKEESKTVYSDLSDFICEVGKGIAEAQKALDLASIDVQNEILGNETLLDYGLNATWYAMPEIDLELKMQYSVTESRSEEQTMTNGASLPTGVKFENKRKIKILPSNAKYNNLFQTSKNEESVLKIKFTPVPVSDKLTERKIMPNLVGLTQEEATEIFEKMEVKLYQFVKHAQESNNDKESRVVFQSVEAGKAIPVATIIEVGIVEGRK